MFAMFRLFFILMIVLTIVYVCLSLYSRAVRRGKLKAQWEAEGRQGDRDAFVEAGLKEYDGSLRRKLILGVYIVPISAIALLVYVTNFM